MSEVLDENEDDSCDQKIKEERRVNYLTKSQCHDQFLLDNHDLENIEPILYEKNKRSYYAYQDIEKIVLEKYGSFEELNRLLDEKKNRRERIKRRKQKDKNERRRKLMEIFHENKLEFKNYGDCYSYIHYGKPDIETILEKEHQALEKKMMRKMTLAKELDKINIKMDEKLRSCYNYVHDLRNLEDRDIRKVIKEVEIENYLKEETGYIKLLDKYPANVARSYAITELRSKREIKDTPFFNEFVISFD